MPIALIVGSKRHKTTVFSFFSLFSSSTWLTPRKSARKMSTRIVAAVRGCVAHLYEQVTGSITIRALNPPIDHGGLSTLNDEPPSLQTPPSSLRTSPPTYPGRAHMRPENERAYSPPPPRYVSSDHLPPPYRRFERPSFSSRFSFFGTYYCCG